MEQLHDRNETLCYELLTGHLAGLLLRGPAYWPATPPPPRRAPPGS